MKIKKIVLFSALAALIISMTSCLGGESSTVIELSNPSAKVFSMVSDMGADDQKALIIPTGPTVNMKVDVTKGNVESIMITGLQYTLGGGSYSFAIENQTYKYDTNGAFVVNVPSYVDAVRNVNINNFRLSYIDCVIGQTTASYWTVSFEIDNRYMVRLVQKECLLFGKSEVAVAGSDKNFEVYNPYYGLSLKPEDASGLNIKADLYLYNAKFAESMPEMNLLIKDIPTEVSLNGFSMNAESLKIYTQGNPPVEQPNYSVSDFRANGRYAISGDAFVGDFTVANRFETKLTIGTKPLTLDSEGKPVQ